LHRREPCRRLFTFNLQFSILNCRTVIRLRTPCQATLHFQIINPHCAGENHAEGCSLSIFNFQFSIAEPLFARKPRAKLNVYGKSQSADAVVSIAGEKSGTEFTIPTSGRSLTLRAYSAERAAMMPWCAETRYTLAVKPQSNAVVRVKANADCSGAACDGSSWEKAFKNLSTALAVAREQGKTVQIAEGRYALQGARSSTYQLGSGMDVRGGFVGIDGETEEGRRGDINKVVISGDVANNDGTIWPPSSRTQANTGDNAYHVVTLLGGGGLPYAQRLDRVNIQGGVADGSGVDNLGAGILAVGASPWLEYLIVQHNQAQSAGGAIYSNQSDTLHLANSYVVENKTLGQGGAVALEKSTSVWSNTVIASNVANSASVLWSKHSYLALLYATVVGNSQSEGQLAWVLVDSKSDATNSIVRGNATEASDALQVSLTRSSIIWDHCAIQGAWLGKDWNYDVGDDAGGNIGDAPAFLNAGNAAGVDGAYYGADDGLQLTEKSIGIDQGVVLAQSRVQEDVFATTRPVGAAADIGAFEIVSSENNQFELGYYNPRIGVWKPQTEFLSLQGSADDVGKFRFSKANCLARFKTAKNKHLGRSLYGYVGIKDKVNGKLISKEAKVMFYLLTDDGKEMTYLSAKIENGLFASDVKTFLMVADEAIQDVGNDRVYALYLPADRKITFSIRVPHSQF
jgi:predicted outer membrane repeat protein